MSHPCIECNQCGLLIRSQQLSPWETGVETDGLLDVVGNLAGSAKNVLEDAKKRAEGVVNDGKRFLEKVSEDTRKQMDDDKTKKAAIFLKTKAKKAGIDCKKEIEDFAVENDCYSFHSMSRDDQKDSLKRFVNSIVKKLTLNEAERKVFEDMVYAHPSLNHLKR
jgi:hypothetical protein